MASSSLSPSVTTSDATLCATLCHLLCCLDVPRSCIGLDHRDVREIGWVILYLAIRNIFGHNQDHVKLNEIKILNLRYVQSTRILS
jgi:hypothetical protein